jgi:hypothetical protein
VGVPGRRTIASGVWPHYFDRVAPHPEVHMPTYRGLVGVYNPDSGRKSYRMQDRQAHKGLTTIMPLNHVSKSSGQLASQVRRNDWAAADLSETICKWKTRNTRINEQTRSAKIRKVCQILMVRTIDYRPSTTKCFPGLIRPGIIFWAIAAHSR